MSARKLKRKSAPRRLTADEALRNELRSRIAAGEPSSADCLDVSAAALEATLENPLAGAAPTPAAETAILASFLRPCIAVPQPAASACWQCRLAPV